MCVTHIYCILYHPSNIKSTGQPTTQGRTAPPRKRATNRLTKQRVGRLRTYNVVPHTAGIRAQKAKPRLRVASPHSVVYRSTLRLCTSTTFCRATIKILGMAMKGPQTNLSSISRPATYISGVGGSREASAAAQTSIWTGSPHSTCTQEGHFTGIGAHRASGIARWAGFTPFRVHLATPATNVSGESTFDVNKGCRASLSRGLTSNNRRRPLLVVQSSRHGRKHQKEHEQKPMARRMMLVDHFVPTLAVYGWLPLAAEPAINIYNRTRMVPMAIDAMEACLVVSDASLAPCIGT